MAWDVIFGVRNGGIERQALLMSFELRCPIRGKAVSLGRVDLDAWGAILALDLQWSPSGCDRLRVWSPGTKFFEGTADL
ncbi:hypothetical protein [Bradyrhizobium sp. sBnM-33]|uniref:hypothetical protein n=1 Tax=Bradyrhizobium sp. sBnM-33 TaxID=2831780 RepID=UPI001BD11E64|nr:hypothetical protein [Bradyrhizobium sp. sBnM-33]WOH47352.1 hypothetical protein RX328_24515 [Bradyrhizobium sp. sBnM-33]